LVHLFKQPTSSSMAAMSVAILAGPTQKGHPVGAGLTNSADEVYRHTLPVALKRSIAAVCNSSKAIAARVCAPELTQLRATPLDLLLFQQVGSLEMHHDVSAAASHSDDVVMAPVAEGAGLQCTHDGPDRGPGAFIPWGLCQCLAGTPIV
jgi:hypothetical protein